MTLTAKISSLPFPGAETDGAPSAGGDSPRRCNLPTDLRGPALDAGLLDAGLLPAGPGDRSLSRRRRHRSVPPRLTNPRRHDAPRRPEVDRRTSAGAVVAPRVVSDGLPVGTRVRFERRPAAAPAAAVARAEFAQVAASYVFAAALLACTFLI